MLMPVQIEELIDLVTSLDRPALIRQFDNYQASFPLDFTHDFLDSTPLERLQHIFLAVCLQSQRMPYELANEAA
jgi:hypothetical protein